MSLDINYSGANYEPSEINDRGAGSYSVSSNSAPGFISGGLISQSFEVIEVSLEVGRRGIIHQYPYRDQPWFEDFGRKYRKYNVKGLVHGPDHLNQQQLLITSFETTGIGNLTLPAYGTVQVWPVDVIITNNDASLGTTEFDASFVEAGEYNAPGDALAQSRFINTRLLGQEFLRNLRPANNQEILQRYDNIIANTAEINFGRDRDNRGIPGPIGTSPTGTNLNFKEITFQNAITQRTLAQYIEDGYETKSLDELVQNLQNYANQTDPYNSDDVEYINLNYAWMSNLINEQLSNTSDIENYISRQEITDLRGTVFDVYNDILANIQTNSDTPLEDIGLIEGTFTVLEGDLERLVGNTPFNREYILRNGPLPVPVAITQLTADLGIPQQNLDNSRVFYRSLNHPMLTDRIGLRVFPDGTTLFIPFNPGGN